MTILINSGKISFMFSYTLIPFYRMANAQSAKKGVSREEVPFPKALTSDVMKKEQTRGKSQYLDWIVAFLYSNVSGDREGFSTFFKIRLDSSNLQYTILLAQENVDLILTEEIEEHIIREQES